MKKTVVVIGAGVSGLVTIKACLEEDLDVIAYELTDNVGGLWNYREKDKDEVTTVHDCTFMNSSKEISALSDFPPPDHYPNFLHHTLAREYLKSYAEHFKLDKYIRFRHKVIRVKENKDHSGHGSSKRWTVDVLDTNTSLVTTVEVDAIAVCSGQLHTPHRPPINGMNTFKGEVTHSVEYRTNDKYKGKRVVVIGIGNTGADIAVDLCGVASKVYVSTRKGTWVFKRAGVHGLPNDLQMLTRAMLTTKEFIPRSVFHALVEKRLNANLNHEAYGLKPKHRPFEHGPTVNDDLPYKLLNGSVKIKRDVTQVLEDGILFQGEDRPTRLDAIILCTGYRCKVPFLDIPEEELWTASTVNLYKHIIPPDYGDGTLGFVGYVAAFGPVFPAFELQGRWLASVISGKVKLPSTADMKSCVREAQRINRNAFMEGERESWYADYLPYCDDLAKNMGIKPNFTKMICSDPILLYKCLFGPFLSYQYRLEGPNAWPGAREAIVNYYDRVLKPFKTCSVDD